MATASVRVNVTTRALIAEARAARGPSTDDVVIAGLSALARADRQQRARAEALALRDDPADLAEIAAIRADVLALSGDG